ncbi:smpA / OmlA family protein [Collimonas arenae]|uniref:SmpA / OmlA family protein n=1 Tax=Collimonas arenae TaxID=279058 RepID=A0A127QGB7_9BURK|nr:hypothetical protein [Collimonas arenae]AMO99211.1 smpA / OmlA family protein [Collimonas arenae]AMP09108.1 smpA / OmlA family protein [Collimonas arenae]
MKHIFSLLLTGLLLVLTGCASLLAPPVNPGEPEAQVISRLGKPTGTYQDGNDTLLEYSRGYFGQATYMARIGPDQKLISYEQVLTLEKFATIKVNQFTEADVLRTVGKPIETIYYNRVKLNGWNYGFKESGVWNSMMTIYFDDKGIVRKLENGPDPRFEHTRFGF